MGNKNTCGTCRFRGTYYCAHPQTSRDESPRCLKFEIAQRIIFIKNHMLVGAVEKPSVEVAEQWLEEWERE